MSTKEIITKDLSHVDISMLKQYATANQNTTDTAAADKVVDEFLKNYKLWKEVVGYMPNGENGARNGGTGTCFTEELS